MGYAGHPEIPGELLRLLRGDDLVVVRVEDEEGRVAGCDIGGRAGAFQVGAHLLARHVAEQVDEALGHEHRRALVAHGQQVAGPGHVHHRLHPARLVGVRADVPAGAGARGAEERDEMPAGALPPGPDLRGVDVELRRVRPQVADGALHVDDLVRPVPARPEPVIEADHHEPLGDQGRPDAVDDEAAGVDEGVVEGVWANAEAANRVATRAAISFFMFNPLRSLTSAIQANQVE